MAAGEEEAMEVGGEEWSVGEEEDEAEREGVDIFGCVALLSCGREIVSWFGMEVGK